MVQVRNHHAQAQAGNRLQGVETHSQRLLLQILRGGYYLRIRVLFGGLGETNQDSCIPCRCPSILNSRQHSLPVNASKFLRRQVFTEILLLALVDEIAEGIHIDRPQLSNKLI